MNHYIRNIITLLITISILFTAGCAKTPSNAVKSGKQLIITLNLAGKISPTDENDPSSKRYYFIAIDNDANSNTGPWAVTVPPFGGTGWVTSSQAAKSVGVTSFIEYDEQNPTGNIYNILAGSYFLNTTAPQSPIRTELLDGGSTLRFTIDFSQVATSSIPVADINQLDISFITTNKLAVDPNYTYPGRKWDSLGSSGKNYVTIDTTTDRTYSDQDETGDVSDSDLDIVNWSVEVQTIK